MEGLKSNIPFRTLENINNLIHDDLKNKIDTKRNQSLRTYDKDYIKYILRYQVKFGLSDRQISSQFKLSRTTIAKWKKGLLETK